MHSLSSGTQARKLRWVQFFTVVGVQYVRICPYAEWFQYGESVSQQVVTYPTVEDQLFL